QGRRPGRVPSDRGPVHQPQGPQDRGLHHGTDRLIPGPRVRTTPTPLMTMAKSRILIIEDERSLADVLALNLQREGLEVTIAHDGRDGLRQAQLKRPDLIVLDLMLPGMPGLDVCRELRAGAQTRDVPIIMVTAKAEESDELVGLAVGADDYVTKPYSVKVLVQRIKKELKRRQ